MNQKMSFYKLLTHIKVWCHERKITDFSTPLAQAKKTLEEVGELIEAATKYDSSCNETEFDKESSLLPIDEYKDAVGDIIVTLIAGCSTVNVDIVECMEIAYNEIKDRTGHLTEEGIFVKDS